MDNFAYGYKIVIDSYSPSPLFKTIRVDETKSIPYKKYPARTHFETNQDRTIYLKSKDKITTQASLSSWIFVVQGVVSFHCDSKEHKIYYKKYNDYRDDLMKYWLFHIVLPLYFTLDGTYYFLHTGCVVHNDTAMLFMGDSYAGKSTLTDYFLKKGHDLLSDDKLATQFIDNTLICQPSHIYHRPFREMETLGIKAENFTTDSRPISVAYWITPVNADAKITIKLLSGLEKFKVLRYSTEMDISVNQKNRFEYLTKLSNTMQIFTIEIPRDMDRLDEVYKNILKHYDKIKEKM